MQDIVKFDQLIGNTPLVELQRLNPNSSNKILAKLEGNNPAGSVKDRAAFYLFAEAERKGQIKPGDSIIEATSGNTGIALAMVAAIKGYKISLIMPDNMSEERKASMLAFGANLICTSKEEGMEGSRDLAKTMEQQGKGFVFDQFNNPDNALAHYKTTGPEIWQQTDGKVTHFVSSMGTTGTIMGVSKFLKEKNPNVVSVGLYPKDGAQIPGIRCWSENYRPTIFDSSLVDEIVEIEQGHSEDTMRAFAKQEGIMAGVSSGGAAYAALELSKKVNNATIVFIVCDRGDRYLSTGVYNK